VPDLGDGRFRNRSFSRIIRPRRRADGDDYYLVASSFNNSLLPFFAQSQLESPHDYVVYVQGIARAGAGEPKHKSDPATDMHAGESETSVSMIARPDLVHLKERVSVRAELEPLTEEGSSAPADRFVLPGGTVFGIISSTTDPFCSSCDRSRLTADGRHLADDTAVTVFDGTTSQPTIEGPKFYKRNGYYYIFAPAGGVTNGWQTVLRSKSVRGPYEERIVLRQGRTPVNGPHQGGWIETPSGESWFVHFQDRGPYGRIVHLQPMVWRDDWPVIGADPDGDDVGEPVAVYRKPSSTIAATHAEPQTSDEFDSERLGLQWQWEANEARMAIARRASGIPAAVRAITSCRRCEPVERAALAHAKASGRVVRGDGGGPIERGHSGRRHRAGGNGSRLRFGPTCSFT
jgi:hypothetical protein